MHLFDCCPISDGAACILLVAEEIANRFTDAPLHVVGLGQGSGRALHAADDLTYFEATRHAAKEAYDMSGLTPEDIQFAEVHDCFSIAEILHIEDLGFFKPGGRAQSGGGGLDEIGWSHADQYLGGVEVQRSPGRRNGCGAVN